MSVAAPQVVVGLRTLAEGNIHKGFPSRPWAKGHRLEGGTSRGLEAGPERPKGKAAYLKNNANSWLMFTLIKDVVND